MPNHKFGSEDPFPLLQRLSDDIAHLTRMTIETSFDNTHCDADSSFFDPSQGRDPESCSATRCRSRRQSRSSGEPSPEDSHNCGESPIPDDMPCAPVKRLYEDINTLISSIIKSEARKLHQLAVRDPLTQLYNRHFFNEVIEREAIRSERSGEPLSFIMLDLDHFKQINDEHGHLAGDDALKHFAELIRQTIRRSDLAFRFGGDEFLILMLNADVHKSSFMIKRLEDNAAQWNRDHASNNGYRISFSMGCATRFRGDDIRAVLRKADSLMYLNKKSKKEQRVAIGIGDAAATNRQEDTSVLVAGTSSLPETVERAASGSPSVLYLPRPTRTP